ncbi:heparinase II/III family protein [Halobacillus litoralis]|uniref:heparinase II/III family protein n=1 Tax=Halobacillus litoralis TaxID=45668 RepID=UPI00136F7F74|nr:heparinase II/III family protein [Halobacillus litoralis]MYL36423.1 hypothetical protein [Halobacillus litoralis]
MNKKIKLYINTVKYLKISQIYYRIINRVKREFYKKGLRKIKVPFNIEVNDNLNYLVAELDYNSKYLDRFKIDDLFQDNYTFINITNKVKLSEAWNNKELQHLWRYNLHYFEYLHKLTYEFTAKQNSKLYYEKYKYLIDNWINNNPFPYGDGWHPYTISLRITNWISSYTTFKNKIPVDNAFDDKFHQSLFLQYEYLKKVLEKDVLGNHYFENIKALIIGSIYFKEENVKEKTKIKLLDQLREQILEDGMHFEFSPMYHKIILEDLIKITYWLKGEPIYNDLLPYLQKMIDVTYSIEEGIGKTPSFNDSTDGISKDYMNLLYSCESLFSLKPNKKTRFEKSGIFVIEDHNKKLIFDTGDICPAYLPAHAHCDALSYELSVKGKPLIVNSGTFKYEYGKWRNYFRSTKAHNTVSIANEEQSQFWGSFRVANRIKNVGRKQFSYKDINFYVGEYTSYNGTMHKRCIGNIDEQSVIVLDYVNKEDKENINNIIHFIPGTHINIQGDTANVISGQDSIEITTIGTRDICKRNGWYSKEFNVKEENEHLTLRMDSTKNWFGYLIKIGSNKRVYKFENGFKVINGREEQYINFDELGDFI